jgi:hypothetical protein
MENDGGNSAGLNFFYSEAECMKCIPYGHPGAIENPPSFSILNSQFSIKNLSRAFTI